MVWVRYLPEADPGAKLSLQFRTQRDVAIAGGALCLTDPRRTLFGFLQGLVYSQNAGLNIINSERKHLLGPKASNHKNADDEMFRRDTAAAAGRKRRISSS